MNNKDKTNSINNINKKNTPEEEIVIEIPVKHPGGRKSKYELIVVPKLELIGNWCREGLLEEEICKRLGIAVSTFNLYKNQHSELLEVLKNSKEIADYKVEDSLYKRALGYKYDEVTRELCTVRDKYGEPVYDPETGQPFTEMKVTKIVTKEVTPDTTAQIFWLKNRRPDKWRDKQEIEHSGHLNTGPDLSNMNMEDLRELAKNAKKD
jgi:hypothetical protein